MNQKLIRVKEDLMKMWGISILAEDELMRMEFSGDNLRLGDALQNTLSGMVGMIEKTIEDVEEFEADSRIVDVLLAAKEVR